MKTRRFAIALATLLLVSICEGVFFRSVALAQQPPDAVTEVARQRYEEGVRYFDAGKYEDARSAFLQAYALKRHPAVLLNLGLSELRTGKYVEDAGNHLQQFLREHAAATPDQRASAERSVADAKKRTAFLAITVDASGADVSVDGTAVGKSPLADPVFVKPGKHTLLASLQGKTATVQVDAKVGAPTPATLNFGGTGVAAAPVAAPLPPGPAQPDPAAPVQPGPQPGYPPNAAGGQLSFGGSTTGPETSAGGGEPFFKWYTRTPLAWVGTGVAGVGLVLTLVGSIVAGSASSAADDHTGQIETEIDRRIDAGSIQPGTKPCGPADSSGERDLADFKDACNVLRDDFSKHDTGVALAVTGGVLLGVGVIGTVTYALIDWYPKKKAPSTGHVDIDVQPVISPGYRGLGVTGSF
ncbi:MAG: hypothetical protein WKG00_36135 [Polyangiaceae bacterium]